jgi:cytochrome o ubiquinol oxidase operon protein cyoD
MPRRPRYVLALAFAILIACRVLFGSLWIMANLNHNMMPAAYMARWLK